MQRAIIEVAQLHCKCTLSQKSFEHVGGRGWQQGTGTQQDSSVGLSMLLSVSLPIYLFATTRCPETLSVQALRADAAFSAGATGNESDTLVARSLVHLG